MEKLIELVRQQPVLYDTSHPDYMRLRKKDVLWAAIAQKMKLSDGRAAKEQWRKLRECHREALRRQLKRSATSSTPRPWSYQREMEFLLPFMSNKTVGSYPSTVFNEGTDEFSERSQSIEKDEPVYEEDNDKCCPPTKKVLYADDSSEECVNDSRDDALYQFFIAMYTTTKGLPRRFQWVVRRKVFDAVSQAEESAEMEPSNYFNTPSTSGLSKLERPFSEPLVSLSLTENNIKTEQGDSK